ncbi:hypothetical protein D030_2931A, partial [Vibrio parahaemolyticus AQ3810]
MLPLA